MNMRAQRVKSPSPGGSRKLPAANNVSSKLSDSQLALLADLNYDMLTGLAGFWIRRAQLVVMKSFGQHLADLDFRPVEAAALVLIGQNKDVSQNVLAAGLGTDQATMVAICSRLESRDLISRRRLSSDRRYQALSLTAEGKRLSMIVKKRLRTHNENIVKGLSAQQQKQLVSFLQTIVQS
jgi:DNA-binding MarR family transcriptional regulator